MNVIAELSIGNNIFEKTVDVMGIYVIIFNVYAAGDVEVHNINPISHVA